MKRQNEVITSSAATGMQAGMRVKILGGTGKGSWQVVTSVRLPDTFHVRDARWYELVWWKIYDSLRAFRRLAVRAWDRCVIFAEDLCDRIDKGLHGP